MATQLDFFAAGAVGIGPALLLVYYALRRYEYPYVEEALFRNDRLFLSFAVGMVVGVIAALLFNAFEVVVVEAALLVLLGVALFEESFKLAYLNLRWFQRTFDVVFYGASLGAGTAATFTMAVAFQTFSGGEAPYSPGNVAALLALAVGLNGLHFYTGSLQGAGATSGRPWRTYLQSLGARALFALLFAPFLAAFQVRSPAVIVTFFLAAVAVALLLFREGYVNVIPESLPREVRRRLRRTAGRTG